MVNRANELGLQEIAITDHGFRHWFRTNKDKLYDARLTINDLNQMYQTRALLGIEADIISEDGTIDVDAETLALIDILIVGYHRMIKTDFASYFGGQKKTEEAKQKATNAFINAINKYPITILSHLDSILETDLFKIGKACADKGVLVEINNRHTNWNEKQMQDLLASDCMFILSSDAHSREDVGNVDRAFEIVKKYNIPTERIANVEFSFDEMTEEHKELNILYEEFKRKQKKTGKPVVDEMFYDEEETDDSPEISRLNAQTEAELEKIAKEQGYKYVKPKQISPASNIKTTKINSSDNEPDEDSVEEGSEEKYETQEFLEAINNFSDSLTTSEVEINEKDVEPISETENISGEEYLNELKAEEALKINENNAEFKEVKMPATRKRTGKGIFVDFSKLTGDDDKD